MLEEDSVSVWGLSSMGSGGRWRYRSVRRFRSMEGAMLDEIQIPSDIKSILRALTFRNMDVAGPERLSDQTVYLINGHSLTEEELRELARTQRLTSWEIYNYIRRRAGNH